MTQNIFINRRIEHFLSVYENGNIHRAADKLGITQPALSMSIRQIEDMLDTALFERSVKGMKSTPAGDVLYEFAITLRQGSKFAADEIRRLTDGVSGTLRIGAGLAWAVTELPGMLREFHHRFPDLQVDLITGVGDQLARRLIEGKIDTFIAAGSQKILAGDNYTEELLINSPMFAIADPNSAIARKKKVSPSDLADIEWVGFYEDESILISLTNYLVGHNLRPPNFVFRTNSPTALSAFIHGTELVSVLIEPLAKAALATGLTQLNLTEPLWEMPVKIYNRKIGDNAQAIREFKALARKRLNSARIPC